MVLQEPCSQTISPNTYKHACRMFGQKEICIYLLELFLIAMLTRSRPEILNATSEGKVPGHGCSMACICTDANCVMRQVGNLQAGPGPGQLGG